MERGMEPFKNLTVVVLASNEQKSLRQTIYSIIDSCEKKDLKEIIVFLKSDCCPSAAELAVLLAKSTFPIPVRGHVQREADPLRICAEIPQLIRSSHFVIMAADLEMDASSLTKMLKFSKRYPNAIVCASKWHKESHTTGYGLFQMLGSRLVNWLAAKALHSDGKDLFSVFQIYPTALVSEMDLSDPSTFLYEYTLRPVSKGTPYFEVSTVYRKRLEGKPNVNFGIRLKMALSFLATALRLRKEAKASGK